MAVQIIILDDPAAEIATMRKNMEWTQEELAKRADISIVWLNKIETKQVTPSNEMLRKLFDAFGDKYVLKYALEDKDGDLSSLIKKKKKNRF